MEFPGHQDAEDGGFINLSKGMIVPDGIRLEAVHAPIDIDAVLERKQTEAALSVGTPIIESFFHVTEGTVFDNPNIDFAGGTD